MVYSVASMARRIQDQQKSGGGGGKATDGAGKNKGGGGGIAKYLGSDDVYQSSMSELMKTLEQFRIGNRNSRNDVKDAFGTATERMGDERVNALGSLEGDFASRGMMNSGLYGDAVSDYNKEFTNRTEDLTTDRTLKLRDLTQERRNMRDLTQSKLKDLKLDAIRRRAETLGIRQ